MFTRNLLDSRTENKTYLRVAGRLGSTYLGGDSNDREKEVPAAAPSNFFLTSSTFDQPDSTLSRRFTGTEMTCLESSSLVRLTEDVTSGTSRRRALRDSWHLSMNCRRRIEKLSGCSSSSRHLQLFFSISVFLLTSS